MTEANMISATAPRTDQINADTLISGPMTVTIKSVQISGGTEQPVSMTLEGTPLFYRPCKSMSRCLVALWGPDAKEYAGRSLTLYRDPTVKWAGMEVGGIRISHMSHIDREHTMALTASKGNRKPFKVLPLAAVENKPKPTIDTATLTIQGRTAALLGETPEQRKASLAAWWKDLSKPEQAVMKPILDKELKPIAVSGVAPAAESNY